MEILEKRLNRFQEVIAKRQLDLTVVLENVHDPHNVGAVIRSCEAVGIYDLYLLYTEERIDTSLFPIGKSASRGVAKWMKVKLFHDLDECFTELKSRYDQILGTHLSESSESLYELDLCQSTALVFGNEHDGLSDAALAECSGNFLIPQHGMVQSLNISVACAVSVFEASRQRGAAGQYARPYSDDSTTDTKIMEHYKEEHHRKRMERLKHSLSNRKKWE